MKVLLLVLSMIVSINSFADWRCLDDIPKTDEARRKLIKRTTIELQTAKDMEKIYIELADDTKTRRDLAIALAGVSSLPFIWGGGLELMAVIPHMDLVSGFGIILGAVGTDILVVFNASANVLKKHNVDKRKVKKLQKIFEEAAASECSYKKSFAALDEARQKVLEEDFNGSNSNMFLDHILLGQISKSAATKLYAYSLINRILLEKKLADLDMLGRM